MIAHTTVYVTPVVEHWLEREIAQWVHPMKDRSDDPSHHERALLPWSYILLPVRYMHLSEWNCPTNKLHVRRYFVVKKRVRNAACNDHWSRSPVWRHQLLWEVRFETLSTSACTAAGVSRQGCPNPGDIKSQPVTSCRLMVRGTRFESRRILSYL